MNSAKDDHEGIASAAGFQLIKLLGEGGFAKVYMAHDRKVNEVCALKISKTLDDNSSAGAISEAKRWLAIAPHAHIVSALRGEAIRPCQLSGCKLGSMGDLV